MKPVILAFSPGLWRWPETHGSPRYHLWALAERGWPVVYTEPPTRWNWKRKIWRADDRPFTVISPSLVPLFAPSRIPSAAPADTWRNATCRRLAVNALSIQAARKATIHWYGAPWMSAIANYLPEPQLRAQHVNDELTASPIYTARQKRILSAWEKNLQERCDMILCSSEPQARERHGLPVVLLENAIPDNFLDETQTPPTDDPHFLRLYEDAQSLPKPRIGYGGVLDLRTDPEMIRALLRWNGLGSLSFFGTVSPNLDKELKEQLQRHPKVRLYGQTRNSWQPHLYRQMDVLIIAHRRSPFTDAMYPAKLNEYLATGRAIVSVDIPEAARLAGEVGGEGILLADSPEEFAARIERAVGLNTPPLIARRRAAAARRTWRGQAEKLEALLLRSIQERT